MFKVLSFSFLFLSATTPWVYALAEALAEHYSVRVTGFYDWIVYSRLRPSWPNRDIPPLLKRSRHVFPTGYAGSIEWMFRPYLQQAVERWCRQLEEASGVRPWVVVPYTYLAPWVRKIPCEKLIYFNLDDYVLYNPSRKDKIIAQEDELVNRAAITLCLSKYQTLKLQHRHPQRASRIYHYPLGVIDAYINMQPEKYVQPRTVGYIGNLIGRIDWKLIYHVAQALPEITFILVGSLEGESHKTTWQEKRAAVLELPNVQHVAEVPQNQVAQYYWSFAVTWIPYVVKHPFNQASCPTKIMDGIASMRPMLSTDVPECRLYPDFINIFHSAEEAITLLHDFFFSEEKIKLHEKKHSHQLEFIQKQTWQIRAKSLELLLS